MNKTGQSFVGFEFISKHIGFFLNVLFYETLQIVSGGIVNMLHDDIAISLFCTNDNLFAGRTTTPSTSLTVMLVLLLASKISFIYFHNTIQLILL